eukprot:11140808-Alexandrium_andersonii.AAC.1
MSASLVGSEMCIRDSLCTRTDRLATPAKWPRIRQTRHELGDAVVAPIAVSYTHLTLPTICSV